MKDNQKPKFPPREGDLPRKELVQAAEDAVKKGFLGMDVTEVLFKFTCPHCGERCALQEPNKLYENGECYVCGKTSPITVGGFMILGKPKKQSNKPCTPAEN